MFRNLCCLLNYTHSWVGELLLCMLGFTGAHSSTCYSDDQAGLHTTAAWAPSTCSPHSKCNSSFGDPFANLNLPSSLLREGKNIMQFSLLFLKQYPQMYVHQVMTYSRITTKHDQVLKSQSSLNIQILPNWHIEMKTKSV